MKHGCTADRTERSTATADPRGGAPVSSKLSADFAALLNASHYLGAKGARGRLVYSDAHGLIVFSGVASRRLPREWLELSRWCISPDGVGSRQWAACVAWLRGRTDATTIVSYSDPSVGHTGALYRACNWVWAPVWHVLREPPTGAGIRGGKRQRAKHRWVYLLRPHPARAGFLRVNDESLMRKIPWVEFREPTWRRGVPQLRDQDRFKRWVSRTEAGSEARR